MRSTEEAAAQSFRSFEPAPLSETANGNASPSDIGSHQYTRANRVASVDQALVRPKSLGASLDAVG